MGRPRIYVKCKGVTLSTNIGDRVIRVAQDIKKKQKTINYRLLDSKKSKYIDQSTDLDVMKEKYDKYVAELKAKIDIPAHELLLTKKIEMKLIWINIRNDDRKIQEMLFRFYGEEGYLELLDDPEQDDYNTIDDLEDGDCQTVYDWWGVENAREIIKNNPEYEPCLFNYNSNECYIIYNLEKNKELLKEHVCKQYNYLHSIIKNMTKDELKGNLFSTGVVTKDNIEEGKNYWGDDVDVITDEQLNSYYIDNILKSDGDGLAIAQRQITPRFIITEFMKLLEKEPDTVVNISGVKEFGYLKDIKPKKTITLKQVEKYYFNRHKYTQKKQQSEKWVNTQKNWWREFVEITGAITVDDITLKTINDYQAEVYKVYNDGNYFPKWLSDDSKKALKKKPASSNWVMKRFNAIISIFRNMLKTIEDTDSINKALGHLEKLNLSDVHLQQKMR